MSEIPVNGIQFGAACPGRPRWWRRRPAGAGPPRATWRSAVPPFRPAPVDKEAQRRWVVREIDELPPGSVDEAHDNVLDERIDRRAKQWIALVRQEFADYRRRTEAVAEQGGRRGPAQAAPAGHA